MPAHPSVAKDRHSTTYRPLATYTYRNLYFSRINFESGRSELILQSPRCAQLRHSLVATVGTEHKTAISAINLTQTGDASRAIIPYDWKALVTSLKCIEINDLFYLA